MESMTLGDEREKIRRQGRVYLMVGGFLFLGTIMTCVVATVPAFDVGRHGFDVWDMVLGLVIASIKASLVALVFMHLNHEKKFIYFIGILSTVHVTGMAMLIFLAEADSIHNPYFLRGYENPGTTPPRGGLLTDPKETLKEPEGERAAKEKAAKEAAAP